MISPFPSASENAADLGRSEGREAVHHCGADPDFGGLAIGISGSDAVEGLGLAVFLRRIAPPHPISIDEDYAA